MANTWNQVGTLMGPQGPRGATGATGAKGGSVRVANIDVRSNSDVAFSALKPADGVQVGDVVIDSNGDVYAIASVDSAGSTAHVGEAVEGVSVKGPQGPKGDRGEKGATGDRGEKGATGAQGPAGPGITFGQGAPTSASQEGAVYIDTADGFKVYQYGQTA